MLRLCLPFAPQHEKNLSRLKAMRGRYPESSIIENKGKKIAIGGSITETTQLSVVYTPSIRIPLKNSDT